MLNLLKKNFNAYLNKTSNDKTVNYNSQISTKNFPEFWDQGLKKVDSKLQIFQHEEPHMRFKSMLMTGVEEHSLEIKSLGGERGQE